MRRGIVVAGVLLALAVMALMFLLSASLPVDSGRRHVTGIDDTITIRFDLHERPRVHASTLGDAFFAEGWLHASNRLWQMELFRRAGKGRLAELLGEGMLASDKELWRIGVPQLGRQLQEVASGTMRDYVGKYVRGVNAALQEMSVPPPEFLLLGYNPSPWSAEDVFAMGALMAFQSAKNYSNELVRLALRNELSSEKC